MCCHHGTEESQAIDKILGEMSPELEQLRDAGFRLIYETGAPVSMDGLSVRIGCSINETQERLDQIEEAGRARRDDQGNLVGIAGLSLERTAHMIEIDGREFWAWCALDAVGIFTAMKASGHVLSTPPGGKDQLEIRYKNGTTESEAALFLLDGYDGGNVLESWCSKVNFFSTREEAEQFAVDNGLEGDALDVSDVSEVAGPIWIPVVEGLVAADGVS